MTDRLGIGLVGAGWFGALCVKAYAQMADVAVVAVADSDVERAQTVAPPGTRVYDDYSALLSDRAVDIVAINTPPYLHGGMAVQAAQAGKHVFVEKPLATTLAAGEAAVEAARHAGVQLGIDYVLRHHPLHRMAAAIVASGLLGSHEQWALENFASAERLAPDHWFWDQGRSGGVHVEHGVHFFDLCNQLAGAMPERVWASEQRRRDGRVDRVAAALQYGDRLLATFYHSFDRSDREESTTIRLGLSRGHITIEGWIPTELALGGLVRDDALGTLRDIVGEVVEVGEAVHDPVAGAADGDVQTVFRRVRATLSMPDRWRHYELAIQAGMSDLVAAARGERALVVTAADALCSLEVATRAATAATI